MQQRFVQQYILDYRIFSNNCQVVARNICHLVAPRIAKNKMAKDDKYLHLRNIRAEVKPWNTSFGAFLKTEWRVLNSLKRLHWTGRGKTANPQLHPLRVSSLSRVHKNEEQEEAL